MKTIFKELANPTLKSGDRVVVWTGNHYVPGKIVFDYDKTKDTYKIQFRSGKTLDVPKKMIGTMEIESNEKSLSDKDFDIWLKKYHSGKLNTSELKRMKSGDLRGYNQYLKRWKLKDPLKEDTETDKLKKDKENLLQKTDTLIKQRKTQQDPLRKSTLSKQVSDLGSKKADINLKMIKKKQDLEKQKTESTIRESDVSVGHLRVHEDDYILQLAKNERRFYDKKDAAGAIDFASKTYIREMYNDVVQNVKQARSRLIKELLAYWKREGHV